MSWNWNLVLVIAGALLVLVEVALGGFAGFDLVLIGSAFVLGGGIGLLTGSAATGFILSSALCVLYIVVGRRWVRARMRRPHVPTNVDRLIGQRGVVTVRLQGHEAGQVKVGDEAWRALPADGTGTFEPGAVVTVENVDGVTLQVR
jgi:membrane protein implicated in regulation of membrane protease activity